MDSNTNDENLNLFLINKNKHSTLQWYLNLNLKEEENNNDELIHPFLGSLMIPTLGKYSKDSYDQSKIESLITIPLKLKNVSENNNKDHETSYTYTYKSNLISFPAEITNILNKKQKIENNTNSKTDTFIPTENIRFSFAVIHNQFYKNLTKTYDIYNMVNHLFLFPDLDFSKQKRQVKTYPVGMIIPKEIDMDIIDDFKDSNNTKYYNGIAINKLRVEYSSMHIIKEALGFSPNNMKFLMYRGYDDVIVHFYIIIMDEGGVNNHIFYYWIINSEEINSNLKEIFKYSNILRSYLRI